ncbi:hypothetical protein GS924_24975 [Rhodococcus hoagii]|nr:hypothetical protein [Prescottella equi]
MEAAKVVERVLYFAEHHPGESLGVVTFSSAQADAVQAEIERQSAAHPVLADLLGDHDRLDGFFVKSLENCRATSVTSSSSRSATARMRTASSR